jgi:hypothetical protein
VAGVALTLVWIEVMAIRLRSIAEEGRHTRAR